MTNLDSILKSRGITLLQKSIQLKICFFSLVIYGCDLDHKEGWSSKSWHFQIVVLKKTAESPLDCKEIKPVNPNGNQLWIFSCYWSWSSNTLATWWEGPIYWKIPWCWERVKAKEKGDGRGSDGLDCITDSTEMNLSKYQEIVGVRGAWLATIHGS